ncbi:hypothetical protein DFAR_3990016 [Desulfarculales bacterium]
MLHQISSSQTRPDKDLPSLEFNAPGERHLLAQATATTQG